MEKTLILGAGEIGKSLGNVLCSAYDVTIKDKENESEANVEGKYTVMNVCYPYSKDFVKITKDYIKQYKPKLTIIHSTVPAGTTRKIGAVHSPVNGKHPNLAKSILTFIKFIGANNAYDAYEAEKFLTGAGIKVGHFSSSETTELAKIMCTSYYGWNIIFMKEMVKLSEKYGVPFHEAYSTWNKAYNEGYSELGETQFTRPVLKPMKGKIGGHCVVPNANLVDSIITKQIKNYES